MLPGLRFLFAAVVLSLSMLVFGLGAAALLRASHDRFVSTSKIRSAPPPLLAQHSEPGTPTLSLLRVEPQTNAAEPAPSPDNGTDAAAVASTETQTRADPAAAAETSERSTLTLDDLKAAPGTVPAAAAAQPDSASKTDTTVNVAISDPAQAEAAPAATTAAAPPPATTGVASEPVAPVATRADAPPANGAAPADIAQPAAAPKAEEAAAVEAVSEEAVPVPPRLPAARPVIRTSKPKARRVAHKRKHVVRRRVPPPVAEQSFLPGFGGT
jgi:hypothetical protein